jgi:hypothetical protein
MKYVCRIYSEDIIISKRCLFLSFFTSFYVQRLFIQIRFLELWSYFSATCNEVIFLFKAIAKDLYFLWNFSV